MADPKQALKSQLANIEKRCGKSLDELSRFVQESGLKKHGEIRDMLKGELGLGYGDANTLAYFATGGMEEPSPDLDPLDLIYSGAKQVLRPIHERVMADISTFGLFEAAPKKAYVSLRRKRQFAMIGPATNSRIEIGLNMKGIDGDGRLLAQPPGGMCQFKVKISSINEVDAQLIDWIRTAYDQSG